jgi:hypothetical protein
MNLLRLSQLNIWKRYEQRVIEVLFAALSLLQSKTKLEVSKLNEDELSFELYRCLLEANRKLQQEDPSKSFDSPPIWEAQNQPDADDTPKSKRINKRPDFQWGYIDHTEPDSSRSARLFVIECKRLGEPIRIRGKYQALTKLYVQNGIRRFLTYEHGYAKEVKSSAMVGYMQNMDFDDILCEVNTNAENHLEPITKLQLSQNGWQKGGVSELKHELKRRFPISPFHLYHFWVDLRQD